MAKKKNQRLRVAYTERHRSEPKRKQQKKTIVEKHTVTVDGRNPAPDDMEKYTIICEDFLHPRWFPRRISEPSNSIKVALSSQVKVVNSPHSLHRSQIVNV